jgi:hypothetical protein
MDFTGVERICDSSICAYLIDMINDDDKYKTFIVFLKLFDKYAIPCRGKIEIFLGHLERFTISHQKNDDELRYISILFRSTFMYLEHVRVTSPLKRDFLGDYRKNVI